MGGSGTPIDNHSPSLALTYLIAVNGYLHPHGAPEDAAVVGEVVAFAGTAPPAGYMVADGSLLDTTVYGDLFAAIGYTYGGSGSQFALPDLTGRGLMSSRARPGPAELQSRRHDGDGQYRAHLGRHAGDDGERHRHA